MKTKHLTKLSIRMFKARTSRTLLTILGMGVGIGAILFLVGLGYGIQRVLMETIATTDSLLSLDVYPQKEQAAIDREALEQIKTISGVADISPILETGLQASLNNYTFDSRAVITHPAFLDMNGTKIISGRGLDDSTPAGVVVSPAFAKAFDKDPAEMLGEHLKFTLAIPEGDIRSKKVKFVDLDPDFEIVGVSDEKENSIFINLKSLDKGDMVPVYSRLKVKCQNSQAIPRVREELSAAGFSVSSLTDVINQADKVFRIVRVILGFFGLIALLVSAIGMFNTMTVALLERTEEIGIMKSIGASDGDILSMFVFESTVMGFLGGICGIVLAIGTAKIFNLLVNMLARYMGGQPMSLFSFPLWFLAVILAAGVLVGFLTGLIPAKKAGSTEPLEALRYK